MDDSSIHQCFLNCYYLLGYSFEYKLSHHRFHFKIRMGDFVGNSNFCHNLTNLKTRSPLFILPTWVIFQLAIYSHYELQQLNTHVDDMSKSEHLSFSTRLLDNQSKFIFLLICFVFFWHVIARRNTFNRSEYSISVYVILKTFLHVETNTQKPFDNFPLNLLCSQYLTIHFISL